MKRSWSGGRQFVSPRLKNAKPISVSFALSLDARDRSADTVDIVDDQAFGQFENADGATHQREQRLRAATVMPADAAGGTILRRIEFQDVGVEIGKQPLQRSAQFVNIPAGDADEEIVAADVAEKMAFGEEVTPHQRRKQRNGMVAEMEAIGIVERLEIVEVAIAEVPDFIAVVAGDSAAKS